jgi:hypothetical protein
MISLSPGLLCATSSASATNALSFILSSPVFLNRCLFLSFLTFFLDKKSNKKVKAKANAPQLLPTHASFSRLALSYFLSLAMIVTKGKTPLSVISKL